MFTEAITVNAPEQLGNIQIPKRASYIRIRVIMLELSRIASHLLWLGPFMADIGAQTPFFSSIFIIFIFRERELVYDLFEAATGMRMVHNYFRIGGGAADLPHGWIDKCLDFFDSFFFILFWLFLLAVMLMNGSEYYKYFDFWTVGDSLYNYFFCFTKFKNNSQ